MRSHSLNLEALNMTNHTSGPNPPFATIIVGTAKKKFVVHEHLLTHYSDFFRGALSGRFIEAEEKAVKLESDCPDIFVFFVHWLYHQRLPEKEKGDADEIVGAWSKDDCKGDGGKTMYTNLIQLHVLSDKYGISQLARLTLDQMFYRLQKGSLRLPNARMVRHAFDNLPDSAPLCQLLVHAYCTMSSNAWKKVAAREWPRDFLMSMLARYAELADPAEKVLRRLDLCEYHKHADKDERAACKRKEQVKKRRQQLKQKEG